MHIFIDESGDLGDKDLSNPVKSKYFVLIGICTENPKKLARCVVKTKNTVKHPEKLLELKFTSSPPEIKRRLIERVAGENIDIHAIVVDKTTVFPSLMDKKEIYFNWVSGYLIRKLISHFPNDREMNIIVDRRSFRERQEEFNKYIKKKIRLILGDEWKIDIKHVDSKQELCLQAADFIAGVIHQKYRYNKTILFDKIKHKMNIEEMHKPVNNNKREAP